jgi:hypothetical protein
MTLARIDSHAEMPDEWKEAVTFTSVRTAGDVVVAGVEAVVHRLGLKEAEPSGGVYQAGDVCFRFSQGAIAFPPKPADRVAWNGAEYTIFGPGVDGSDWLDFWDVTARNLVLAADLRDACTVLRPLNSQDAAGFREVGAFSKVYGSVPCRLQEVAEGPMGATGDYDAAGETREFVLYVGQRLFLQAQDTVTIGGTTYDLVSTGNWDRVDGLGEVRVRRSEA